MADLLRNHQYFTTTFTNVRVPAQHCVVNALLPVGPYLDLVFFHSLE